MRALARTNNACKGGIGTPLTQEKKRNKIFFKKNVWIIQVPSGTKQLNVLRSFIEPGHQSARLHSTVLQWAPIERHRKVPLVTPFAPCYLVRVCTAPESSEDTLLLPEKDRHFFSFWRNYRLSARAQERGRSATRISTTTCSSQGLSRALCCENHPR